MRGGRFYEIVEINIAVLRLIWLRIVWEYVQFRLLMIDFFGISFNFIQVFRGPSVGKVNIKV